MDDLIKNIEVEKDWDQTEIDLNPIEQKEKCITGESKIEHIILDPSGESIRIFYNNGIRFSLKGQTVIDITARLNETIVLALNDGVIK